MSKKTSYAVLSALLALVLLAACAPAAKEVVPAVSYDEQKLGSAPAATEASADAPAREADAASEQPAGAGALTDRMIIRTVYMTVTVEDTEAMLASVSELVDSAGGYVASSRMWRQNEQVYASLAVRVPAEDLDRVLDQLRGMVIRVEDENASGEDVTEEYTDLQSQLRNLEATETELLALLTEVRQNRGKAEDILAVHQRLTEIRGQIETLKGRSQYLERMTALATIQLEIRPKAAPQPIIQDQWNPLVTVSKAARAFVGFVQVILDVLIYLVLFSPVFLVPILIIWLLVRASRRRKERRAREQTPPTAQS